MVLFSHLWLLWPSMAFHDFLFWSYLAIYGQLWLMWPSMAFHDLLLWSYLATYCLTVVFVVSWLHIAISRGIDQNSFDIVLRD